MSEEKKHLLFEARKVEFTFQNFNTLYNQFVSDHFSHSLDISTYIYKHVGDEEVLECELTEHLRKFRVFCEIFSKLKRLTKYSTVPSTHAENTIDETFEFSFDYNKNEPFISNVELNKLLENLEKYDKKVVAVHKINCLISEDFKLLKKGIGEMNIILGEENVDIVKLRAAVAWIKYKINSLQLTHYNRILHNENEVMRDKYDEYHKKYYHKFVMKRQNTFSYDRTLTGARECAVCLESFVGGKSVTQLKCRHVFCTGCVEKWLASSVTCPCCRKNPRFSQ